MRRKGQQWVAWAQQGATARPLQENGALRYFGSEAAALAALSTNPKFVMELTDSNRERVEADLKSGKIPD